MVRVFAALAIAVLALAPVHLRAEICGEVISVATHDGTTTRYAFAPAGGAAKPAAVLVLLVGGSGVLDLDGDGCPRGLKGNSLVRSASVFRDLGFATALVDAPSDHHRDEDGLAGFRSHAKHAEDLGRVVAALRAKTGLPVWLVGTSRGTISAVNAASRLKGTAAPDGIVLTSALMEGGRGRKSWVRDSVFDHDLAAIGMPALVVGHAEDKCVRSPPDSMERLGKRLASARKQVVTVTGGEGGRGRDGLEACVGRSPHGFIGQERDVAEGIARFVKGGSY